MLIKTAEFVTSALKPHQYPPDTLPEIVFAGRSNVGKSSCINTLLNRKRLVKTSSTPGRTQMINFFCINADFYFVDLPGYGYARVPAEIKKKWGPMVEAYIAKRNTLRGAVVLIDIRRQPGLEDSNLIAWLQHYHIPVILVFTKVDKLSKLNQKKRKAVIAEGLAVEIEDAVLFSAKTRQGKDLLSQAIEALL